MSDIVYYFVPRENMGLTKEEFHIDESDLINWREMRVTESYDIYDTKGLFKTALRFTLFQNHEEMAQLLWELIDKNEKLSLNKKLYRFKKVYNTEPMENKEIITTRLEELRSKYFNYAFLYKGREDDKSYICNWL